MLAKYFVYLYSVESFDLEIKSKFLAIMEEGVLNWVTHIVQLNHKQIYSEFPKELMSIWKLTNDQKFKETILSLINTKLGTKGLKENIDEIKSFSKPLADFIQQIL